jgi:long-chain acyl-CoA synthetase
MTEARPWLRFYGDVPASLGYPDVTVYEAVMRTVRRLPDATAYDFMGRTASYRELGDEIDRCANGLFRLGLEAGDRITISMPTSPQGVIAFYAAAKLGAVASMIHPLSTSDEIAGYLDRSGSRFALTLDAFYANIAAARPRQQLEGLIIAQISDYLAAPKRWAYRLTQGRKLPAVPDDRRVYQWRDLLRVRPASVPVAADPEAPAAILYSGGTTGAPKGIVLSHRNFVSEGLQVAAWVRMDERDTILAVLPIFHGFGLSALINAGLMSGARIVMVPTFTPGTLARLITSKRPTLMAGVPTLYEALSRDPSLRHADLSCLRAAFSGADTLTKQVKDRFEQLAASRGGRVKLLEGYGLTEAVTAVMGMPLDRYREGSIGVPFPDTLVAICEPSTVVELPPGNEGEICISGPAVMLGYLDDSLATADTLRTHADGRVWLHTGDIGVMDADGFFSFTSRLKRMIKSSGFNVYPSQVEAVLCEHPAVESACVVGIPDEAQGERVKAFVIATDSALEGPALAAELIAHCRERLIKWSCPRDVEFRRSLPTTRIGKIDYAALRGDGAPLRR